MKERRNRLSEYVNFHPSIRWRPQLALTAALVGATLLLATGCANLRIDPNSQDSRPSIAAPVAKAAETMPVPTATEVPIATPTPLIVAPCLEGIFAIFPNYRGMTTDLRNRILRETSEIVKSEVLSRTRCDVDTEQVPSAQESYMRQNGTRKVVFGPQVARIYFTKKVPGSSEKVTSRIAMVNGITVNAFIIIDPDTPNPLPNTQDSLLMHGLRYINAPADTQWRMDSTQSQLATGRTLYGTSQSKQQLIRIPSKGTIFVEMTP